MASRSRVFRGRATQEMVADWFRRHGWPDAQSRPASLPGTDVMNMLGLAPEVKATTDFDMGGAMKQASKNAKGDLPFVVRRINGWGLERITDWPVVLRLEDFTALLKEAGYGSPDK